MRALEAYIIAQRKAAALDCTRRAHTVVPSVGRRSEESRHPYPLAQNLCDREKPRSQLTAFYSSLCDVRPSAGVDETEFDAFVQRRRDSPQHRQRMTPRNQRPPAC
jgi:hypothetical protein